KPLFPELRGGVRHDDDIVEIVPHPNFPEPWICRMGPKRHAAAVVLDGLGQNTRTEKMMIAHDGMFDVRSVNQCTDALDHEGKRGPQYAVEVEAQRIRWPGRSELAERYQFALVSSKLDRDFRCQIAWTERKEGGSCRQHDQKNRA